MLFNSGEFLFFFVAVWLLYQPLNRRWQNGLLLVASYVFYSAWDYRFLTLVLISTGIDFTASLRIETARAAGHRGAARAWMWASVVANLGMLGFFKYFNFFAESFADFMGLFGLQTSPFVLHVILPVGISFYTFQTMSYTLDVYRGTQTPIRSLLDFALFVAFFPQLMAGPIERAGRLVPQIQSERRVTVDQLRDGGWLILWGVFKKVYIADNLSPYANWAFGHQGLTTGLETYTALTAAAFQIYCDFSGYSDIARGLAKLMGFELTLNFDLPFFSKNPAELWRRWHITLGSWVNDYVFRPLTAIASTRQGKLLALVPAMALVGLWHGAAWTFVWWGTAWGVALYLNRLWRTPSKRIQARSPWAIPIMGVIGTLLTYHLFVFSATLFMSPSLAYSGKIVHLLFSGGWFTPRAVTDFLTVGSYIAPLVLMQCAQFYFKDLEIVRRLPAVGRLTVYVALLALLMANGSAHLNEFFYFQF